MAQSDLEGNIAPYQPPTYVSTPTPNAGAAGSPSGGIVSGPPASGSGGGGGAGTVQSWYQDYLNSPEKKAADEATSSYAELANMKASLDKKWEQKNYELAKSLIGSGGGSYGAGLAQAEAIDKLNKEKAAHDLANQQEYTREALGSRGLSSSGQMAVDQGELKYNYDMLIKQIDLAAAARRAQAAQAAANANRGVAAQLARLEAEHQQYLDYQPYNDKVLLADIQNIRSKNENAAIAQFKNLRFDEGTGRYYGDDGTSISVSEAQQSIDVWAAADPANAAATSLYTTSTAKSNDLFGY